MRNNTNYKHNENVSIMLEMTMFPFQAESVSYSVCAYYGITTNENSFGYIASWSKDKELPELRASLELINQTAGNLITEIDTQLAILKEEREQEMLTEKEALYVLDQHIYLHIQKSEEGYDYTFYERESKQEIDGGQLDNPTLTLMEARQEILALYDLSQTEIEKAPLTLLEDIEASNRIVSQPDSYRILQLNRELDLREYRFESLEQLEERGFQVEEINYCEVYEGIFTEDSTTNQRLHALFEQFNYNPPKDFTGHSLSVSDILALKERDVTTYYYVDRVGFQELPGFHSKSNPLRSLEDSIEQNDNNLDGIINNLPPVKEPLTPMDQSQILLMGQISTQPDQKQSEKKQSLREKLRQSMEPKQKKPWQEMKNGREDNDTIYL